MASAPPSIPPLFALPWRSRTGAPPPFPPCRCGLMPERRTAVVTARVTATESADWRANRHKGAAEAVEVLARLVAIERALTALARFESPDDDDAH